MKTTVLTTFVALASPAPAFALGVHAALSGLDSITIVGGGQ